MNNESFTITCDGGRPIIVMGTASQVLTKEAKSGMPLPQLLAVLERLHTDNEKAAVAANNTGLVVTGQELNCDEVVMIISSSDISPICIAAGSDVKELDEMIGGESPLAEAYEFGKTMIRGGAMERMQYQLRSSGQPAKQEI
ncbi:hypothetical protein [Paraburkholderia dinghuensis]|uniref:Uncharacterized protein n=1 Tax=Paraburkholderia dinghuensis TaxID=2305225 RepID=A0A3N6MU68_9BURK|nr:hypothetical protein [Paraburkholderia dinghuensis]RQG99831.1 hypothetical protein D1Y85_26020 [Paraburkholderia dinghuensis]